MPVKPQTYFIFFFYSLLNNWPACATQHGSVWDFIYDGCATAVNFIVVNKLWHEWIILAANVSFSLGVEQEESVSYLSKLVLYPFVKHTWKTNIDVSECNSFGFTLYSVFISPVYFINIEIAYRDRLLDSADAKCVNLFHLVLVNYLFSMVLGSLAQQSPNIFDHASTRKKILSMHH